MKTQLSSFFIVLALLSGSNYGAAQSTRFFSIAGPAAATVDAAASVVGRGLGHDAGIVRGFGDASIGRGWNLELPPW